MSSNKNEDLKLPEGWVLCPSKSNPGRKYYFNKKTGKSSWTKPQAEEKSCRGKQKNKKEKTKKQEKSKIEESTKKSLKRKSDGDESFISLKKKHRDEIQNYTSPNTETVHAQYTPIKKPEKQTPSKSSSTNKKETPRNSTPSKNIANSRLSMLRAQLNAEAEKEESTILDKAASKSNKHKVSPNSSQTDTLGNESRTEIKSPVLNESKCSTTTQSPSSDGVQSAPSPSQFFAANKIISSMKAQLPEQYYGKSKQKDTFADIEEGICNQTPEYPFMKHPATPPQFSEASKLVSAIKSRLSYKTPAKDTNVKSFGTAQDRMASLRSRLSNDVSIDNEINMTENGIDDGIKYCNEAMDVDFKEVTHSTPSHQYTKNCAASNKEDLVLVVDTNVFIHELDFIKNVLNSHIKGYSEPPNLLVPWRVINELDRLKDNNNGNGAICKRAKSAMDYLYKSLPENNRIKGQSLRDANSHIYPCEIPDDEILNCCLQQSERGKSVILLSNDKNLCNKAVINGVKSVPLAELRPLLEAPQLPAAAADGDLASFQHYRNTVYQLLANILENEMRAKYNNLWQHVLFKAPPWTLEDVLQCLLKHWIAVFNEVFPRIEHLLTDLKHCLISIESKDPKSLTQSEVTNFKELCLDVAKKCQIIPEYMELAKLSVERLESSAIEDGEAAVVGGFEALWTVFSNYCARVTAAPAEAARLPHYAAAAAALHAALQRAVSTDKVTDDQVLRLEAAVRDSLALIGVDCKLTTENMRIFCTKCSNMLQEAYTKFRELTEVLDACENSINNI
ncbi:swt1 RNA endoribonuclease [Aphomia sociella]